MSEQRLESSHLSTQLTSFLPSAEPVEPPEPTYQSVLPTLTTIFDELSSKIIYDLRLSPEKLKALNPSRKQALANYIESQNFESSPRLEQYFEELARLYLGQALLLKVWSDRGIRRWSVSDLAQINWILASNLKPLVPLDRTGWQLTTPNIYSWYSPPHSIQEEVYARLEYVRLSDEGPDLIAHLLKNKKTYNDRFFETLWEMIQTHLKSTPLPATPIRRRTLVFSPTLRDGGIVRTGPVDILWHGLENNLYALCSAELIQLWWGPSAPPLWIQGSGLEVYPRPQLALHLNLAKPNLVHRLSEMEAFDIAFVFEENPTRLNSKQSALQNLKEQCENATFLKRLRNQTTSLGALQACISLSKLRPGGILFWAREEPLSLLEGKEVLNHFLETSTLLQEWDLSSIEVKFETTPLYPKYLYLFQREPELTRRLEHRPLRTFVQGPALRSQIEISPFLKGLFLDRSFSNKSWSLHHRLSPTNQKEWLERWPEQVENNTLLQLEEMKKNTLPLATLGTLRPLGTLPNQSLGIKIEAREDRSSLKCTSLLSIQDREVSSMHASFALLLRHESWIAPIEYYLESQLIKHWLDHHCERRADRWILSEQVLKFIPVPVTLLNALGASPETDVKTFAHPLPGEWEKIASEIDFSPQKVLEKIKTLDRTAQTSSIKHAIFVRSARIRNEVLVRTKKTNLIVNTSGKIQWRAILDTLPPAELVSPTLHSFVSVRGHLPGHTPISRIQKNGRSGKETILLTTESGYHLELSSALPNSLVIDILWSQLEGVRSVTWNELLTYLRVPRHLELAQSTAEEFLRHHGQTQALLESLSQLLNECLSF